MREYDDDNIRLYMPILQRIIILVAIIIAVPVVMWTITFAVRTYVAPPGTPTFQRMTENQPSDTASGEPRAAPIPAPAAPAPAAQQGEAATPAAQMADASTASSADTRTPLLEIKKPVAAVQPQSSAAPVNTPATGPTAATQPAAAINAQPGAGLTAAGRATPALPASAAPAAIGTDIAAKSDSAAGPAASDRAIVWPNPQVSAPPQIGADTASATEPPPPQPTAVADTAAEELPAANPIAGQVPLPRQRPNDVAMLQAGFQGIVPLPRARPADAPADASATSDTLGPGYDPGMTHY